MAFPERSAVRGAVLASWDVTLSLGRGLHACLLAWEETKLLPAWELLPSWERPSLEGVLLGGLHCPREGCMYACKELAITIVDFEVTQVIFPSFLSTNLVHKQFPCR